MIFLKMPLISLYIYKHLKIYILYIIFIYLYIYLSIYFSIYLPTYLSIYLSICLCIYLSMYLYLFSHLYTNSPINAILTLAHLWSGDSQGQKRFLALSTDNQTCNYHTECSNYHPPYKH